ncbi:MAG: kumamolisin, partial [Candidatus Eremiobacteraeota bacterium]|nr:kumamolisin [Candidatus Eremiobacteraeota bacterium]
MRTARILATAAAVAILAACGGGGGTTSKPADVVPPQTPTNQGAASPSSTSFKYLANALKGATLAGPVQLGTMKVDVQMNLRDAQGLQSYAAAVGDPSSGLYRHFLTPEELGSRFGATDADWNAAMAYFTAEGLQVTGWKQKSVMRVVGPQAKMEHAFGTTFALYHLRSGDAYGPTALPHFSKPLAVHSVTQIVFNPSWMKRNSVAIAPHGTTPAFNFGIPPQQIAGAFDYTGAYAAGYTGTGVNIGIIGTGPIDSRDYTAFNSRLNAGWYDGSGTFHPTANTITQVNATGTANVNGGA